MSALAEVGPHPAPVVNMLSGYDCAETVADDAQQQWAGSALGFDAYGATAGANSSLSYSQSGLYPSNTSEETTYTSAYIPQQILPHLQNIPEPSPHYAPYVEQDSADQTVAYSYGHGVQDHPAYATYDSTAAMYYPQQEWSTPSAHVPSLGARQAASSYWREAPYQLSDGANAGPVYDHVRPASEGDFQNPGFHSNHPSDDTHPSTPPSAQRFSSAALSTQAESMERGLRQLTLSGHDHRQCLRHTEMSA